MTKGNDRIVSVSVFHSALKTLLQKARFVNKKRKAIIVRIVKENIRHLLARSSSSLHGLSPDPLVSVGRCVFHSSLARFPMRVSCRGPDRSSPAVLCYAYYPRGPTHPETSRDQCG